MELKCDFNGESAEGERDRKRVNRWRANEGGKEADIKMTARVNLRVTETMKFATTAIKQTLCAFGKAVGFHRSLTV